jgi:hypothetical protein
MLPDETLLPDILRFTQGGRKLVAGPGQVTGP